MAALQEQFRGDPHRIRFESEGAGLPVETEVIIYQESMKTLTHSERDLLKKVVTSHATVLALAMFVKENMSEGDWEGYLKRILGVNRDTISDLQAEGGPDYTTKLLGIDISPVRVAETL